MKVPQNLVHRFERTCLQEAAGTPLPGGEATAPDGAAQLTTRLVSEQDRLAIGARLSWIEYARQQFKALAKSRDMAR